ncbi:MAG: pyrroline-5-carboxylate reductase, partial [uncultured bacterium]
LGFRVVGSLDELLEEAQVVLLAVKPQDFRNMKVDFGGKLVVSIMAGVPLADLPGRAVRVMPNLGAKVGKSVSSWVASDAVTDEDKDFVREFLSDFGVEVEVRNDDEIDKMTALTGSGPAYVYVFMRALTEAGREFGFGEDVLKKILPVLIEGSLEASSGDLEDMIAKVASKGGTTEAALNVLGAEWGDKLKEAVRVAYDRAKEL